jgi:xanthine dehydrogenase YagT iron-sulfur-binding subunit
MPEGDAMPDDVLPHDSDTNNNEKNTPQPQRNVKLSRRDLLKIGGVAATAGAVPAAGLLISKTEEAQAQAAKQSGLAGPSAVPVALSVNGKKQTLQLEPRVTLLDALRNHLDLTGAKKVCDRGQCGACTVSMNGKPVMSCMTLAIAAQGAEIQTIEGLAKASSCIRCRQRSSSTMPSCAAFARPAL